MSENDMFPAERLIESVDRVLGQLGWTPWAFRLEEDGTLVADPDCFYFRQSEEAEDDEVFFEEYEKKAKYQARMWEEYKEVLTLSPFSYELYEKVQDMDRMDISGMTWTEVMEEFLKEELPLVRMILRTGGFWHEPVADTISDEALNQLIAFRYKERLVQAMERVANDAIEYVEEEEDFV